MKGIPLLILFSVILSVSFTSAALDVTTNAPESMPQNFILNLSVSNATQKITTGITCDIVLNYGEGQVDYSNYSTSFLSSHNLSSLHVGTHTLKSVCWTANEVGTSTQLIKVTKTGETTGDFMETLIWFLFIAAVMGNLIFFILILVKLVTTNETVFGVLSAWGFYILMLVVNYQSGFLTTRYITTLSEVFLNLMRWSNVVLPIISLVITMFVKGTKQKRPIGVEEFTGKNPLR